MKTNAYYRELLLPPIIAIAIGFTAYFFCPLDVFDNPEDIISKVTDISFILFGFLLTILALIMQANESIRSSTLYTRLIRLNRKIVFVSLRLGVYSLFSFALFSLPIIIKITEFLQSVFSFLLSWLIIESVQYIVIFYKLVLKTDLIE